MSCQNVYARMITIHESYTVVTNLDTDLDKIVSRELLRELKEEKFTLVTPPDLKTKRNVILTRLDDYIYNQNEAEIKELVQHNTWISIEDVRNIQVPQLKTIKVTFDQTNVAEKAQEAVGSLHSANM